jgi:hypothetical protein
MFPSGTPPTLDHHFFHQLTHRSIYRLSPQTPSFLFLYSESYQRFGLPMHPMNPVAPLASFTPAGP